MRYSSTLMSVLALSLITFAAMSTTANEAGAQVTTSKSSVKKKTIKPTRMRAVPPRGALTDGRSFSVVNGKLNITRGGVTTAAAPGRYPTKTGEVIVVDAKRRVSVESSAKPPTTSPKKRPNSFKSKKRIRRAKTTPSKSSGTGPILVTPKKTAPVKKTPPPKKATPFTITPVKKSPVKKTIPTKKSTAKKSISLKKTSPLIVAPAKKSTSKKKSPITLTPVKKSK